MRRHHRHHYEADEGISKFAAIAIAITPLSTGNPMKTRRSTVLQTLASLCCGLALTATTAQAQLSIGQLYQGGKIAYIFQLGEPGYVAGETHGLIAAATDQSTGIRWDNGLNITTGATETNIGSGNVNTVRILANQGTPPGSMYAAKLCFDLVLNGYSDWYLPSKDELLKLYSYKVAIGGFSVNYYWSSSEYNDSRARILYFGTGWNDSGGKGSLYSVRAVRTF